MINELIESHDWTIERILDLINAMEGRKLELGKKPLLEIENSSKLRELEMSPLPLEWIKKNIITAAKKI